MANFLGITRKMGVNIKAKHVANIAKAARLRPPKTSSRSHLLTTKEEKQVIVSNGFCLKMRRRVVRVYASLMQADCRNAGTATVTVAPKIGLAQVPGDVADNSL